MKRWIFWTWIVLSILLVLACGGLFVITVMQWRHRHAFSDDTLFDISAIATACTASSSSYCMCLKDPPHAQICFRVNANGDPSSIEIPSLRKTIPLDFATLPTDETDAIHVQVATVTLGLMKDPCPSTRRVCIQNLSNPSDPRRLCFDAFTTSVFLTSSLSPEQLSL